MSLICPKCDSTDVTRERYKEAGYGLDDDYYVYTCNTCQHYDNSYTISALLNPWCSVTRKFQEAPTPYESLIKENEKLKKKVKRLENKIKKLQDPENIRQAFWKIAEEVRLENLEEFLDKNR